MSWPCLPGLQLCIAEPGRRVRSVLRRAAKSSIKWCAISSMIAHHMAEPEPCSRSRSTPGRGGLPRLR